MGQEESTLLDDSVPPHTLTERSLSAVASYIKDGPKKRIVVLTGAGISTAAGSMLHSLRIFWASSPERPDIEKAATLQNHVLIINRSPGFPIAEDWSLQQPCATQFAIC